MKWGKIKLLAMDVDGVLTDGSIFISGSDEPMKRFDARDGMAISIANRTGIVIAFITGRGNLIVKYRAKELKVPYCFVEEPHKERKLKQLIEELGLDYEEVAYMGDDLNDLAPMALAGIKIAPHDAAAEVLQEADYVTVHCGGHGAVREVVECILKDRGEWEAVVAAYKNAGQGDKQ